MIILSKKLTEGKSEIIKLMDKNGNNVTNKKEILVTVRKFC